VLLPCYRTALDVLWDVRVTLPIRDTPHGNLTASFVPAALDTVVR
jgi:hypothetical protein